MSAKADKGDRKREIEQSPMKKKFRDSAISREALDDAIANRIELAFKEQQSTLNSVVNSAVRDAMYSVLIPALRKLREDIQATNKSVKELREEFEAIATAAKQTRDRVDSVQADAREDRRTATDIDIDSILPILLSDHSAVLCSVPLSDVKAKSPRSGVPNRGVAAH